MGLTVTPLMKIRLVLHPYKSSMQNKDRDKASDWARYV